MLPASRLPELGWVGRHSRPHFLTWRAGVILPSSGACPEDSESQAVPSARPGKGLSKPQLGPPQGLTSGSQACLGIRSRASGACVFPQHTAVCALDPDTALCVEEGGLGALPTQGLSTLCWVKRSSSFFGDKVQADTRHINRYCMLGAHLGKVLRKPLGAGNRKAQLWERRLRN